MESELKATAAGAERKPSAGSIADLGRYSHIHAPRHTPCPTLNDGRRFGSRSSYGIDFTRLSLNVTVKNIRLENECVCQRVKNQ